MKYDTPVYYCIKGDFENANNQIDRIYRRGTVDAKQKNSILENC